MARTQQTIVRETSKAKNPLVGGLPIKNAHPNQHLVILLLQVQPIVFLQGVHACKASSILNSAMLRGVAGISHHARAQHNAIIKTEVKHST